MSAEATARVQYFDRQYLRTQDFVAEQAYHLAMRRRHNIGHHTWGIVSGLELVFDDTGLRVQPGVAIDGYGRELVLPERVPLGNEAFLDKGAVLDVALVYNLLDSDPVPLGYGSCGDDTRRYYRRVERPDVSLERTQGEDADRRHPAEVAEGDQDFGPNRTPYDDPRRLWPVFLGTVTSDLETPPSYTIDQANRPYAGLRGEAIAAPSGRARMQLGAEHESDPRRFAVSAASKGRPLLEVTRGGRLTVRGDARVNGDLTLTNGAVEFRVGAATSEPPVFGNPWRIYGVRTQPASATDPSLFELRIELGGEPPDNQLVVGAFSEEDRAFRPVLTVAGRVVTVDGSLVVKGGIDLPPLVDLLAHQASFDNLAEALVQRNCEQAKALREALKTALPGDCPP
jgi:hypothetical protein